MSETALSKSIIKELRKLGIWAFRVNSGRSHGAGGMVQGAPKGTPDLCLPALGWLESKVPGGKPPSPAQVLWHQRAAREGVRVATVRSVGEAVSVALEWREADRLRQ